MHKKHKHTSFWVAGILWVIGIVNPWCHTTLCVCVLAVINYLPHAGDLLRLLITSPTKPTGGWFSYTNSESISVWGLVYLCMCTHVTVCVRACVIAWNMEKKHDVSNLMMVTLSSGHHYSSVAIYHYIVGWSDTDPCFLISTQHRGSDATCVCTANHQHGLPELSAHCTGTITTHERWEILLMFYSFMDSVHAT